MELGSGVTDRELLDDDPTLRPEHIRAALPRKDAAIGPRGRSE